MKNLQIMWMVSSVRRNCISPFASPSLSANYNSIKRKIKTNSLIFSPTKQSLRIDRNPGTRAEIFLEITIYYSVQTRLWTTEKSSKRQSLKNIEKPKMGKDRYAKEIWKKYWRVRSKKETHWSNSASKFSWNLIPSSWRCEPRRIHLHHNQRISFCM